MADLRRLLTLGTILLVFFGLTLGMANAQEGETVDVDATDQFVFEPAEVEIEAGTTVRWTNTGNHAHTVTSRDGLFNEQLPAGATFEFTFEDAGTFDYYCIPHDLQGMEGAVIVQEGEVGADTNGETGQDPNGEPEDPNDTPGPAALLLVAALIGLFALARRH